MLYHYTLKLSVRIKPVHGIFRNIVRNANIKIPATKQRQHDTCFRYCFIFFMKN